MIINHQYRLRLLPTKFVVYKKVQGDPDGKSILGK